MTWQFVLTGLLIGSLVGMTGMGGGSLMTPLLILIFGFKPTMAVGTDIVHGAIFKTFGALRHRSLGTVNLSLCGWMLLGSAPLSLLGVWVADVLERRFGDGVQTVQKEILGGALVVCGIGFLVKAFLRPGRSRDDYRVGGRARVGVVAIGLVGGFVVGLTSVGSGTFFGLALLLAFPLSASVVVGTDIFHAAALLWVAGIGHVVSGNVDFGATGWLLVGSIPGVLLGSHATVRLPDRALRVALASVLAASGIKLLDPPAGNALFFSTLGVGATLLLVVVLRARPAAPAPAGEVAPARRAA